MLSRDTMESSLSRLLRSRARHQNAISDASSVNAMNDRNSQPMLDCANECTEGTGPPRLMNMPICAKAKAAMMRMMFHILNIPRRFCTIIECTKAVMASHGIRAEFSTGSQAQ